MSKIYDYENQLILRLPDKIAKDLNEKMTKENQKLPDIEITPYMEIDDKGIESMKFKFVYDNKFKSQATLVNLPTISDSYRTMDSINLFKSNDISQMIYVHPENNKNINDCIKDKNEIEKVIELAEGGRKIYKVMSNSGISAPTKYIRKRFFKKRPIIPNKDVQQVESELSEIIKDLTRQSKNQDDQMAKPKRRYRRKD